MSMICNSKKDPGRQVSLSPISLPRGGGLPSGHTAGELPQPLFLLSSDWGPDTNFQLRRNSRTTKVTSEPCSAFRAASPSPPSRSETFHHLERKPRPPTPPLRPLATCSLCLSLWSCLSWTFHVNAVTRSVTFCVGLFHLDCF